jgi:hypothetical protein
MKKLLTILLIVSASLSVRAAEFCCGECMGGCDVWCIWYEKDFEGHVESYVAFHLDLDGGGTWSSGETNPEFIGMNPGVLDSTCDNGPCI